MNGIRLTKEQKQERAIKIIKEFFEDYPDRVAIRTDIQNYSHIRYNELLNGLEDLTKEGYLERVIVVIEKKPNRKCTVGWRLVKNHEK